MEGTEREGGKRGRDVLVLEQSKLVVFGQLGDQIEDECCFPGPFAVTAEALVYRTRERRHGGARRTQEAGHYCDWNGSHSGVILQLV